MKTRTAIAALALSTLALPLAAIAPATASGGGGGVRTHGACQGAATWKLKAKPDSGRIEVEAEVHGSHSGQAWDWTLKHNGSVSSKGAATTHGTSHSFSVGRRMTNLSGKDHFVFRAERRATGDVCRGTISL
jgi:hypothetical protein